MAQVVGGRGRRPGEETIRLATTLGAVALGVGSLFGLMWLSQAGMATSLVIVIGLTCAVVLGLGKAVADRRLGGGARGRRAEDTETVAASLARLPDGWWVFRDFFLAGSAVEFLVVGPGGVFAVEVYRWLARDTGTAFHERMSLDLAARTRDVEATIARLTGWGDALGVQPVYVYPYDEGLAVGDLLMHPTATDLRHVHGVVFAVPSDLLPLLRTGGSEAGVRTSRLEPGGVARVGRLLQQRARGRI